MRTTPAYARYPPRPHDKKKLKTKEKQELKKRQKTVKTKPLLCTNPNELSL
jgi:hypothetical protein